MTIVGFVEAGAGGGPVPNIFAPVGPVLREVLSVVTTRDYCELTAAAQSGLQDLGLAPAAFALGTFRNFLQCPNSPPVSASQDCPTAGPITNGFCFTGGQCEGITYGVTITIDNTTDGDGIQAGNFVQGPIQSVGSFINTSGDRVFMVVSQGGAQTVLNIRNPPAFISAVNIVRQDGQPDDCGDPPTGVIFPENPNLPPPPAPGDVIMNQFIENITVVNDQTTMTTTSFDIAIGPITFEGEDGIRIPIPGFPDVTISPSGELNVDLEPEFDFSGDLDVLSDNQTDIQTGVDGIQMEIDQSFAAVLDYPSCIGDNVVLEASGAGFAGLAQLIALAANGLATQNTQFCELLPSGDDAVGETVLQQYTVNDGNEEGIPIPLTSDIVAVRVQASIGPDYRRVIRGSATGDPTGRFGFVSFGVDYGQGIAWGPVESQWYLNGVFMVPRFTSGQVYVRVASYGGVSLTVLDTGLRA